MNPSEFFRSKQPQRVESVLYRSPFLMTRSTNQGVQAQTNHGFRRFTSSGSLLQGGLKRLCQGTKARGRLRVDIQAS